MQTARRVSHVFVIDVPTCPLGLIITDAAVNIVSDHAGKHDIMENEIDLACAGEIALEQEAILAAVETVYPKIAHITDATPPCKLAQRGQIVGAVVDSSLPFGITVSEMAVKPKGIISPDAGSADILVVLVLLPGDMLAKQLKYRGDTELAGFASARVCRSY